MNTFFALALACTLSTAPNVNSDDKLMSRETSTYVITDKVAIWLTDAGKLKLAMGHHNGNAIIELRDQKGVLHHGLVNLRKGAQQTFDLSQINEGTYQIQVTIGEQVTTKTIRIERSTKRVIQFS